MHLLAEGPQRDRRHDLGGLDRVGAEVLAEEHELVVVWRDSPSKGTIGPPWALNARLCRTFVHDVGRRLAGWWTELVVSVR